MSTALTIPPNREQPDFLPNIARGVALFWGGFALLGVTTSLTSGFNPNLMWVDLRWLPFWIQTSLTISFAVSLLAFAAVPRVSTTRRKATAGILGFFLVAMAWNCANCVSLRLTHQIEGTLFAPASLPMLASLLPVMTVLIHPCQLGKGRPRIMLLAVLISAICFPLLQVYCFGKTDYERPSSAAVVFGARVLRDGRMTMALADRVERACELYRDGQVRRLVFSGGPGDGAIHETDAMRTYALKHGVPDSAIIIDRHGVNTEATVVNSLRLLEQAGVSGKILAVSEFYHLPRIKLAFQAHGREVYTVPAIPSRMARNFAFRSVLREVPAFWVYYARSVLRNMIT